MSILEKKGFYYGADISGGGGIVIDRIGGSDDYHVAEVDGTGAVIFGQEEGFQRGFVRDLGSDGAQLLGVKGVGRTAPKVKPGETLRFRVGKQNLLVEATGTYGVRINGQEAGSIGDDVRYPKR